jgi:hypothetical protein
MKYIKLYEGIDFNDIEEFDDHSPDFIGFEEFEEFLKKNNALDKFIKNFYNFDDELWKENYWGGYNEKDGDYTIHDFLMNNKKGKESGYIDDAFGWAFTPEDSSYWNKLDNEWSMLVKQRD